MKLLDGTSGELFAHCPIKAQEELNKCVESVSDSSRYFVLRVADESGTRHSVVGVMVVPRVGITLTGVIYGE